MQVQKFESGLGQASLDQMDLDITAWVETERRKRFDLPLKARKPFVIRGMVGVSYPTTHQFVMRIYYE